jgi:hypothetical protein
MAASRFVLSLLAALGLASAAAADELLRVAGTAIGADGVLTRRVADVVGTATLSRTQVLEIDGPRIAGASYRIVGKVAYEGVEEEGYLEMWSEFADGGRYFSRTMGASGPMGKLFGSSPARPFELPFQLDPNGPKPVRLELAVVLMGPGLVTLSDLRFESEPGLASAGAWWSDRTAGLVGGLIGSAVGILGALIGTLASLGRGRAFVLGSLQLMAGLGAVSLAAGLVALSLGQPYAVWYPLTLTGALCGALGLGLRGTVRRRYAGAPAH